MIQHRPSTERNVLNLKKAYHEGYMHGYFYDPKPERKSSLKSRNKYERVWERFAFDKGEREGRKRLIRGLRSGKLVERNGYVGYPDGGRGGGG